MELKKSSTVLSEPGAEGMEERKDEYSSVFGLNEAMARGIPVLFIASRMEITSGNREYVLGGMELGLMLESSCG